MTDLYFDLLPHDLITALSYYFPWKTIQSYCDTLTAYKFLCKDMRFLRKYISNTERIAFTLLADTQLPFLIEYLNAIGIGDKFRITMKYDYVPLFVYYLEKTSYGREFKITSIWDRSPRWINKIMSALIGYKAYDIIHYLMETYNKQLDKDSKEGILYETISHDDVKLFKYFIEDLHYDRDVSRYVMQNVQMW